VPDEAPWPPPPSSWPSEPTASESTGRDRQSAGSSLTSMAARASGSLGYVGADNSTGVAKEAIARNRVRGSESLRGRADGNSLILKSEQILVDFRLAVLLCRVVAILAQGEEAAPCYNKSVCISVRSMGDRQYRWHSLFSWCLIEMSFVGVRLLFIFPRRRFVCVDLSAVGVVCQSCCSRRVDGVVVLVLRCWCRQRRL